MPRGFRIQGRRNPRVRKEETDSGGCGSERLGLVGGCSGIWIFFFFFVAEGGGGRERRGRRGEGGGAVW